MGPNLAGLLGGKVYPLFNPRKQSWKRHFRWDNTTLVGKTFSGKVTVQVLNINEPSRVMLRENLLFEGRFPSDEKGRPFFAHVAGIIGTGLAAVRPYGNFSCACHWNNRYTQARRSRFCRISRNLSELRHVARIVALGRITGSFCRIAIFHYELRHVAGIIGAS